MFFTFVIWFGYKYIHVTESHELLANHNGINLSMQKSYLLQYAKKKTQTIKTHGACHIMSSI